MKITNVLTIAAVSLTMALTACKTQSTATKTVVKPSTETSGAQSARHEAVTRVAATAQTAQCVTSKIKFNATMDGKSISLGGKLLMKRDDVIRLQLTALGLFEAGRVEFTKDYVLVVDRLNKQYVKLDYSQVDFLKQSGLNFYSLQSLFWNELFLPGHTGHVTAADADRFTLDTTAPGQAALSLHNGQLTYRWTTDAADGLIKRFDGTYKDQRGTTVGLDWQYDAFRPLGAKRFPTGNAIKVTTPKKSVSVDLQLSSPNTDSDWETRTEISSRYRQVKAEDILKKLSSM